METWTLPEGWEWVKVGDLVNVNYGDGLSQRARRGGNVPVYGANGVVGYHDVAITRGRTIIIGRKGSAGAVNWSDVPCWPIDTTFFIDEFPEHVFPKFLYYFLQNRRLDRLQQSAAIPGLNRNILRSVPIPIPYPDDPARSLAEQRRIVARLEALLSEVRALRDLLQSMRRDWSALMESALAEVFCGNNTKDWKEVALGTTVQIVASLVDPTLPEYRTLPHINGECIRESTGELLAYNTAEQDGIVSVKYLFKAGDVLYSKIRPYLRKAVEVDFTGVCSADVYPLSVTSSDLLPGFLKWILLSHNFTNYAIESSKRARMPKINRSQLFSYPIRYPALAEQRRIVAYLEAVQEEVSAARRQVEEDERRVTQLEQSILAAAFRGEV